MNRNPGLNAVFYVLKNYFHDEMQAESVSICLRMDLVDLDRCTGSHHDDGNSSRKVFDELHWIIWFPGIIEVNVGEDEASLVKLDLLNDFVDTEIQARLFGV